MNILLEEVAELLIYMWIYYLHFSERNCVHYFLMKIWLERMFHARIYAPIPVNVLPPSKSFLPLENVWKYINYLINNSRFRKRQLWTKPWHTVCPDVCMLFRILFFINKIAFIISIANFLSTKLHFHFTRKIQQLDHQLMLKLTF